MRRTKIVREWVAVVGPLLLVGAPACGAADGQSKDYLGAGGGAGMAGGASTFGGAGMSGAGSTFGVAGMGGAPGGMPGSVVPAAAGGASAGGGNALGAGGASLPSSGGQSSSSGGASSAGGTGNAGGGGAAAGGAGGGSTVDSCVGGKVGADSAGLRVSTEYGAVKYQLATSNEITGLTTTLAVPKTPTAQGTLFIWPGLQWYGGKDPARIGNGILQPVLTWGGSCAPMLPPDFNSWWIAAMYVNVSTAAAGPTGCAGGASMKVDTGHALKIDMTLSGTTWKQVVKDEQTSKSVDYSIDLKGQAQDWATFAIELPNGGGGVAPTDDVVFSQSVLTFASPVTSCQPNQRGPNDYFSAPVASPDGLRCCFDKIILRAKGVPVTSP